MNIKKLLRRSLDQLLKNYGYKLSIIKNKEEVFSKNPLLQNFYNILIKYNFQPKHILDVGANHGTWTRAMLSYFPETKYSLVEPQYWLKESFQDLLENYEKINFYPVGVGRKEGEFKFTLVDRDDSCSFRYTEEEAFDKGFKQISLPIITIDQLISENNLPIPEIVKIDAEGLDIEVLEGASTLFGKTEIFLVEAGVMNTTFCNNALSVISYLDEKGYRLFDITDLNRPFPSKVLWLVELVFIKKNGFFDKQDYNI